MPTVIKAGHPVNAVRPALARVGLTDHMAQARQVLAEAEAQAERLLARAKESASAAAALAHEQARQAGHSEGFEKGLAQGRQAGIDEGRAAALAEAKETFQAQHAAIAGDAHRVIEALHARREALEVAARRDVLEFAVRLAEKVTFAVGSRFRESAAANLERALRLVHQKSRLTVRAHPADLEALRTFADSILPCCERADGVRFEADESVAPGGCIVGNDRTEVDARLETQLDEIVALLLGSLSSSDESPAAGRRHEAEPSGPSAGSAPETPNV